MSTFSVLTVASGILVVIGLAGAVASAKEKEKERSDSSKFATLGQCKVSPEGRLQFMSSKNRFRGALRGASYGDIFFAGGAGNRGRESSTGGGSNGGAAVSSSFGAASGGGWAQGAASGPGGDLGAGGAEASGDAAAGSYGAASAGGVVTSFDVVPSAQPEPASLLLIGTGLGGLLYFGRRKRVEKH